MTVCVEKGIIGFVIDVDSYFADNVIVGGDGRFFGTTAVADKLVALSYKALSLLIHSSAINSKQLWLKCALALLMMVSVQCVLWCIQ